MPLVRHRSPFLTAWSLHWLLVLALLWVPLAASAVVQKTASGDFLAWPGASGAQTLLEAAPCLGFEDSEGESALGICVAENNRLLHKTETQKAAQLATISKGKFTQKQIEDAMRNSGNKAKNESVTTGMVNPGAVVEDKGAVFNVGGDGKSVVQTLPNGGRVDPELAAYIIANTGGANSPYAWSDAQTAKTKPPSNANAGLNTMTPNANGCITAECAAGMLQTRTDNRTQAQIDASLNQTTTGIATAPLWVPMVGGAVIYSPLGFALGAGGDAAGQAYQSYTTTGEVRIRPAQTVFSGLTGAVALPLTGGLPAVGFSTQGAGALVGNAVVGGATGAANTQFNNLYYDEATSLSDAAKLGGFFGGLGSIAGIGASRVLSITLSNSAKIPLQGPAVPFAAQGTLNPLPSQIGNSMSNTIGAVPAFIPLANGNSTPATGTEEKKK